MSTLWRAACLCGCDCHEDSADDSGTRYGRDVLDYGSS